MHGPMTPAANAESHDTVLATAPARRLVSLGRGFWLPVALVAATLVVILLLPLAFRSEAEQTAQQLLLVLGFLGVGGIFGWVGLHTHRSGLRRAWLAWALAWFCIGGEQAFFWFLVLRRNGNPAEPSLADGWSFLSYVCVVVAVSSLPTAHHAPARRWQIWLDGSILACACLGGSWYFILGPLVFGGTETALERASSLGYALSNVMVVIAIILLLLRGVDRAFRPTFFILMAGILCPIVADTFVTIFHAHLNISSSSTFVQASSLVGGVVMALAPLYHVAATARGSSAAQQLARQSSEVRASRTQHASPLVTYIPIIGLYLLAGSDSIIDGISEHVMTGVDLIAVVAAILVVTRQLLTINENVRLLHDQQWALQAEEHARAEAERANTDLRENNVALQVLSEKATESARLKSEFLANMSHEIRTPMNGIIGMTELALQGHLDAEVADYLHTAHDSALALLAVLNDILDFSKVEAGRLELESLDFEPKAIAESVGELLVSKAAEKRLALMTEIEGAVPNWLNGDPLRIRQILLNLTGNAIKFTERGHVVVRIRTAPPLDDDDRVRLCFEVSDTGIGISEEARGRLFQAFTQADGSTTRKYGGTGLGLSISKRLVELMGGEIGVKSAEGQGSTFWFVVPFAPAEHAVTIASEGAVAAELRGRRVLIVDDNEVQRTILRDYLAEWGLEAMAVATGGAALERMRQAVEEGRPFDLALLDLVLPGPDGFAVAQALKLEPRLAATPLVLMTAYDEVGLGRQALHVGFASYLTKPIKRDMLLGTLLRILGDERAADQGADEPVSGVRAAATEPVARRLPFDGRRILLAEDNVINRKLANLQLRQLGCEVETVINGIEAVARVREGEYELVLMDCHMPEMDGFEATAAIRAAEHESGAHVPIIAMTADALQGDRERCIAAGMDDYISKPVTLEDLTAVLARQLPARASSVPTNAERSTASETLTAADNESVAVVACDAVEVAPAAVAPAQARLLLVEDNLVNQHLMALQLAKLGCTVDIAANGREALSRLGERDYALVLMDCNMPEMDGYEATTRIRALEAEAEMRHLPIIAVTANAVRGDRERALRAGMDDYLPKPIKLPELRAALTHWGAVPAEGERSAAPADPVQDEEGVAAEFEPLERAQIEAIRALQVPGAEDVLAGLLDEYASDTAELLEQMRRAEAAQDTKMLHLAAHSLKSSSAYLGAKTLAAICADLERLCATAMADGADMPVEIAPLIAQIETAYRRVRVAMDEVRRPQPSPTGA